MTMADEMSAFEDAIRDFASSELFNRTFSKGMTLVEETAAYLDGPGREESRALPRKVALAYAGESMRLTTRLMQVVSWLLVQKAVREGEMKAEEAAQEKYRLGAREICQGRPMLSADLLPERLLELMEESRRIYEQVSRLDQMMYAESREEGEAPVAAQHRQLEAAFCELAKG